MLNTGHSFDFNSVNILFKCNDIKIRRIIEAALICLNKDKVVNLDTGFFALNVPTAKRLLSCINFKSS